MRKMTRTLPVTLSTEQSEQFAEHLEDRLKKIGVKRSMRAVERLAGHPDPRSMPLPGQLRPGMQSRAIVASA